MPLMKSGTDKAFMKNMKAEMNAGKPQKQAVAIASSVRDKAKGGDHQEAKGHKPDPKEHSSAPSMGEFGKLMNSVK